MVYPHLTHSAFRDFNFSAIWDPSLRRGPSFEALFRLVYETRQGDRSGALEFGDTMYFTLRPAAFEAYQRAHGPHAFTYDEWFYSKVKMFFEVLVYSYLDVRELATDGNLLTRVVEQPWKDGLRGFFHHGDCIEDEEIELALIPEDNERIGWDSMVREVSASETNRVERLQDWLRRQPTVRAAAERKTISWTKNRERDAIIARCLGRRMERADICKELDKHAIPTLPSLQKVGFQRWSDGWKDPDGQQAIQQVFSKKRPKAVNSR